MQVECINTDVADDVQGVFARWRWRCGKGWWQGERAIWLNNKIVARSLQLRIGNWSRD